CGDTEGEVRGETKAAGDHRNGSEASKELSDVVVKPHVQAEAIDATKARVAWGSVTRNGVEASRYRVVCQTEDPHKESVKVASTKQTVLEIGTLEPRLRYTCSVYAIWDDLVPEIEVVSPHPGISNVFTMPGGVSAQFSWILAYLSTI
uniref:Fibronectin type-III domain-containing protein n=1 Tax=Mesocestoides corti TaxID=53468 RepID=A0A5K3F144_MESCO